MESSSQGNLQFLLFGKQIQLLYLIPQIISISTLVICVPYINFVVYTTPPLHFHTQFHRKCPLKLRYCLTGTLPCCACMLCAQDRTLKTNSDTRGHDQLNFLYVDMEICISIFRSTSHAQPIETRTLVNFMTNYYYETHNQLVNRLIHSLRSNSSNFIAPGSLRVCPFTFAGIAFPN